MASDLGDRVSVTIDGHGTFSAPSSLVDRAWAEYGETSNWMWVIRDMSGTDFPALDRAAGMVVLASFYPENPY